MDNNRCEARCDLIVSIVLVNIRFGDIYSVLKLVCNRMKYNDLCKDVYCSIYAKKEKATSILIIFFIFIIIIPAINI